MSRTSPAYTLVHMPMAPGRYDQRAARNCSESDNVGPPHGSTTATVWSGVRAWDHGHASDLSRVSTDCSHPHSAGELEVSAEQSLCGLSVCGWRERLISM